MDDKRKKFEAKNFFNLGMDYIHREFLDKAQYAFEKAVKLDPELALAWAYLSKLYEKHGLDTKAESAYDKAVELDASIDFEDVQKDCRLFEDRNVITGAFNKYQDGRMPVQEFIEFVTKLSPRAIALVANKDSSKRFFRIAVENAALEKISNLDFEGLPALLSKIAIPYDDLIVALEDNSVAAILSEEIFPPYHDFLKFLDENVDDKFRNKIDTWKKVGVRFLKENQTSQTLFEKATILLTIIEDLRKQEEQEMFLAHFRLDTVNVIISESIPQGRKGAKYLLSAFRQSRYDIVNIIGSCMVSVLVIEKERKPILDFYKTIEEELVKMKAAKKAITRAGQWYSVLSSIHKKMGQAISEYDQIINLLDVIEETAGKFEPVIIAKQCLRMIERDLAQEARSQSSAYLDSRVVHIYGSHSGKLITKDKMKRWLDSIKKAYFKLILLTRNPSMKLGKDDKPRLQEIANSLLEFLVRSRIDDLIETTADDRFLRNQVTDVFFPQYYLSFPIPALYAVNEFFDNPYPLAAIIESRRPGIRIRVDRWKLAATVSLLDLPSRLFSDLTYIDFVVPEYLKTLALAVKHTEYDLNRFLAMYNRMDITEDTDQKIAFNLMINIMRGLVDSSATQITREQVIEALEFGEWDTSLCDKIIENKKYCIYCAFELPDNVGTCPNCERPIRDIDLSKTTFMDLDPDFYV